MKIEQIYTGCLAQGAYYIESEGEAAIIDPLRETAPYIEKAERNNAKIKYIFETHFHADFVSGHVDLAKKTGATIVYGPGAKTNYDIHEGTDGETFEIGKVKIKILHTPGHTPESTTYLLIDEAGKNHAIFSGDTLFIGDVGRPDLAIKSDVTQEDLAGLLFDSLRNKIMPLENEVIVYPAHGAGSACGKNMSKETYDTLGHQKEVNYALQEMSKDEFVTKVLDGLTKPPQYFAKNAKMNKEGYDSFDDVMKKGAVPLSSETFEEIANSEGALILDTRPAQVFNKGFIPNSIFIGIDGSFASWVGTLITDIKQPILIVSDEGREEEVVMRLSRVGYDNSLGFLEGGIEAWKNAGKEIDSITSISAEELAKRKIDNADLNIMDVRKPTEYQSEHVVGADNQPLDYVNEHMQEIDKDKTYYLHCAGGYRSMIMASILKARGYENLIDVIGGFKAISETSIDKTAYVCPSTL
ncbi:MBL fold metallo-hydrolase [Chondrinema litorale]|uniref:MBL fold metallo-hydrolase n=1 Tax=Chondrinema litorale TaxID=2994555 RepID=UPI002543943E|nr:MBL fold metallo-hydrolase [Chondrinema litorale]UZR99322.1 MBL fold metallo-hydrolase [Chondrinema litorale]